MNSVQTDAVVLRANPWSETSFIVALLTAENGLIHAVAKGARRPKSSFEGAIDLLSVCRVVYLPKPNDVLDILTEAKLVRRFRSSQRSLLRLHCGYYLAELLLAVLERDHAIPGLFELTDDTLAKLDKGDSPFLVTTRFELKLLGMLGHLPNLDSCVLCGEIMAEQAWSLFSPEAGGTICTKCIAGRHSIYKVQRSSIEFLRHLLNEDQETISLREWNSATRQDVRRLLERYLVIHFDRPMKLHAYLEELAR